MTRGVNGTTPANGAVIEVSASVQAHRQRDANHRPNDAVDGPLAEPEVERSPHRRADAQPTPMADVVSIDFLELLATPPPPEVDPDFDRRVRAVVRGLEGLDRRGIHDVLNAAGEKARWRASR